MGQGKPLGLGETVRGPTADRRRELIGTAASGRHNGVPVLTDVKWSLSSVDFRLWRSA